jgi:ABC-type uncharacterized transport system involved in gliding motility auxiliary subunit
MTTKTQSRIAGESTAFLLVLAAIVVLVNALGFFLHARYDTTERQAFSLSSGSLRLAASLGDRMEIRAYFSEDLPPPHNASERYVRDLLAEYRDASGGKIRVTIVHPAKDEQKQAAERDGVQRVQDQKLESDSFSVHEGFRGVSFHYLGDSKAIPRIDTLEGLEYEISQKIKELAGEPIEVAILQGHESPTPTRGLTSLKSYLPTYKLTLVEAKQEIPIDKYRALVIMHPQDALTETELRHVNQYVMRGGSLAIFGGGVKVDPTQGEPTAQPIDSGLNKLLEKWGVRMDNRIVADAQCGRARMPTRIGIPVMVPYPPVPIITFDENQRKHPVLFRLDQVGVPFTVKLSLTDTLKGDAATKRTVLMSSTEQAWLIEGDNIPLNPQDRWSVPGYNGPFTLAVAIEGKLPSAFANEAASSTPEGEAPAPAIQAPDRAQKNVRVLVFGSGYFMHEAFLPPPTPGVTLTSSAAALGMNAIDWLAQDSDLIEIRAKNVEDPVIEVPANVREAEATIRAAIQEQDEKKADDAFKQRKAAMEAWDQKKSAYRWGNTLGIPAALALFGVVRWRIRRARKVKLS